VAPDDRTVTIDFTSGIEPCNVLDHVRTSRTRDAVTITLFEGSDPATHEVACIEIGVSKSVRIVLDRPVAGRRIVDASDA
jgi:hypothetical protein